MPRPTTKQELIKAANGQFEKMWQLVDVMTTASQNAVFNFANVPNLKEAHWTRDKNLRDVLVHLYEWHQLLLNWVTSNQKGITAPFLPAPYNWKTYGQMNIEFWEKHQSTPLDEAMKQLKETHAQVLQMIEKLTDEELFAKGSFSWTGTTTLGSYCVSATASHYDWAIKKLKLHNKTYQELPQG